MYDAVVVGGGPAGTVCAARLAAKGRRVALLERERHPRFHLGESLLPGSVDVLEAIGVLDDVRARFLVKHGARFVDGHDDRRSARYDFAEAFHAHRDHAFEVPRDAFDELLYRRAGRCGAELCEGWEVVAMRREGGRATGVEVRAPDGARHVLDARFVVDATGRDAMAARASGAVERIAHLDRTALYTQVRGAWRDTGRREGDIQIVVCGDDSLRSWFWLIPFADGRTSVGVVVSRSWLQAHRDEGAGGPEGLFDAAVRESPTMTGMLGRAERLFVPRATSDFSFRVASVKGEGWLAIGDAAGFIDPLFSTGVHLAMSGALRAADAIDEGLATGDLSAARFEPWEAGMRAGADLFLGAVQAFYEGDLVSYLFADPQHPFLRKAITSLLAGDVFDTDTRWAKEMRTRFPVRG